MVTPRNALIVVHVCCESCQCNASRGLCWCKYSLRGDANSDQTSEEICDFLRHTFGYSGPFKPISQVRMEKDITGIASWNPAKPRVQECAYRLCNVPASGWSKEHPPNRTKLTDENVSKFVLCDKCRSAAYCSTACRDADACTPLRNGWDGEEYAHADICEPYKDNDRLPYVSVALRKYKEQVGRYPHPLGLGGTTESSGDQDSGYPAVSILEEKTS